VTLPPEDEPEEAVPAEPADDPEAVDTPAAGSRSRICVYPNPLTTRPAPLGCGSEVPPPTMIPGSKKPGL
jgi:hypothetical protein